MSRILLFNKPFQVLSQFTSDEGDNLSKFIKLKGFYPAGRLDKDSEGLLLLTDDGHIQHKISHPKFDKQKHYWVQVEGQISEQDLLPLRQGLTLKDGVCKPAIVKLIEEPKIWPRNPAVRFRKTVPTSWINVVISEGRNRQVRRMTAAIGFPTLRLIRHQIANYHLADLQPGQYKIIHTNS